MDFNKTRKMKIRNLILENLADPKNVAASDYNKPNAWVSPDGDYYGFSGGKHVIAANYISIYILGKDDSVLDNTRKFFKDSFDSYLLRNGWLEIKDISWLTGGEISPEFFYKGELTQKQLDIAFCYCNVFNLDFQQYDLKD